MTLPAALVYIDDAPENLTPELALRAEAILPERWNGFMQPIATADAFEAFLAAWRRNDPNGLWGTLEVTPEAIHYRRIDDDEPEVFARHGETSDGTPTYLLSGWMWVLAP